MGHWNFPHSIKYDRFKVNRFTQVFCESIESHRSTLLAQKMISAWLNHVRVDSVTWIPGVNLAKPQKSKVSYKSKFCIFSIDAIWASDSDRAGIYNESLAHGKWPVSRPAQNCAMCTFSSVQENAVSFLEYSSRSSDQKIILSLKI